MPYDYEDISTLNDRDIRDLAIEYDIPGVPNLRRDGTTLDPADRERLILQLRRKGVNTRSNAEFNINEQIGEYEALYPNDTAPRQIYMARVPPQTGRGTTTGDYNTWYTIYTTPGGAAFLEERGYELRSANDMGDNGVVVQMPRHRRRGQEPQVSIEAPYGQHHIAPVIPIDRGRRP